MTHQSFTSARILTASGLALVFFAANAAAITVMPDWHGDPDTTYAYTTFSSNNPAAPAETENNPFGSATIVVVPGNFAGGENGWTGPDWIPGSDGQWDLGQSGTISVTIPFSPSGNGVPKNLDVFFSFSWQKGGVWQPPMPQVTGLTPVSTPVAETQTGPPVYGGLSPDTWDQTVWSASFENVTSDSITIVLQGTPTGSRVSELYVYTRFQAIPEPGTLTFGVLAAVGALVRRRR